MSIDSVEKSWLAKVLTSDHVLGPQTDKATNGCDQLARSCC